MNALYPRNSTLGIYGPRKSCPCVPVKLYKDFRVKLFLLEKKSKTLTIHSSKVENKLFTHFYNFYKKYFNI